MMRKKYCEVTEDIEKRVEEKEGTIGAQWRRFLDIEDESEEEQELLRYRDNGTVDVHRTVSSAPLKYAKKRG